MFDLQSDKSLGHHSAHWQVNGRILLLSRDRGRISQRVLTTHSAEGSTIMAPAPVRGRGGLPSDRHSQEQICQAPLKYKKVLKKSSFRGSSTIIYLFSVCDEGPSLFAELLKLLSILLILSTMPFSLFFIVKVVQVSCYLLFLFIVLHDTTSRNMRELSSSDLADL